MKKIIGIFLCQYLIFNLLLSFTRANHNEFVRTLNPKLLGLKQQKLSHFRFYWHDIYSGPNPTVVPIIKPVNSTIGFGFVSMMDDPLTEGPDLSSKLVGRAQGFYGAADQSQPGMLMVMNFVFVEGKYNGSTLTILGRNEVLLKTREMPVIAGTGLFRFATGYVRMSTYSFNQTSGDAVVEYNAYVLHY